MKKFLVHSLTMYNEDAGCAAIVEVEGDKPEIHKEAVRQFLIKLRVNEKSQEVEGHRVSSEEIEEEMKYINQEVELLLPHGDDTPEGTKRGKVGSEFRNVCDRDSEVKFSFWRLEETMYLVTEI